MRKKIAFLMLASMLLSMMLFSTSAFAQTTYERQEKLLTILVEFTESVLPREGCDPEYDGTIKMTDAEYSNLFFGTSGDTVRHYFREVSGSKLDLQPAAETNGAANDGIVRVKLPYPHPNIYESNKCLDYDEQERISHDALSYLANPPGEESLNPYIFFSDFDKNGDGYITNTELHFVFMVANGRGGVGGPWIRANYYNLNPSITLDGVNIFSISNSGFSFNNAGESTGVIRHELAHDMGAIDLYKYPAEDVYTESLMAQACGHLDAWHKIKMGFAQPTVISSSGDYTVNSIDLYDPSKYNVLLIPIDYYEFYNGEILEEYFLIENRQFIGFDSELSTSTNSGGIAIWHVRGYKDEFSATKFRYEDPDKTWNRDRFFYSGSYTTLGPNTSPANSKLFGDGGDSGVSIIVNSTSSSSMSVTIKLLDEPKNLKATSDGQNIRLAWDPVLCAVEYEVSVDNGPFFSVGSNTSYVHAAAKGKHSYKVRAKNRLGGTGAVSQTLSVNSIVYGDVDGDGSITYNDSDLVWYYSTGTKTFTDVQKVAADVDGNGVVDANDSNYIFQYVIGDITQFPAGVVELITYGDVDANGGITKEDSDLVCDYLLGKLALTNVQMVAAEVDGDGITTSLDAANIIKYADGTIKEFPTASIY
ncbi:MAG: dockerin type I domain-containing protein [Bacillota bacterium]